MIYKVGSAQICITPDEPLWLAGFAARTAPARGKISDLHATAVALEDATGERLVIVSADIIGITRTIADAVARAVNERHGIERRQLLLAATHTHYGPEYRPDKPLFFNIPPEYAAKCPSIAHRLIASLVEVISNALERLEPVRLFARRTTAGFAHNRRRHGVKNGRPSPEDIIDHDVPVLDCMDTGGRRKAILFGYACHNTTIPPDDLRYCGGWAGFACQQLRQTNYEAAALFLPGAGADQDPEPSGSVELSRQHGRELADAVQTALDGPGVEISGPIRTAFEDVHLPLQPMTDEQLTKMLHSDDPPQQVKARFLFDQCNRGEERITSYAVPLQVVRLGNELLMIALSGEPVVDWAHNLKRRLGAPLVWVAGYCNDMFGYLPTRRVQAEGGYEAGRANLWSSIPAPFTDDVEEQITAAIDRLIVRSAD